MDTDAHRERIDDTRPTAGVLTRPASLADAEAIREIYNAEVLGSTVTFDLEPRSLADQRAWLAERTGPYAAVVAVDADGAVVGFGSLSPWRSRPAYRTSVENSVYVHADHQGRGIGRLLLEALVDTASDRGFHTVFARIVGGHVASVALHERVGFERVGVEREVGRKFGRWLDVVVMQRMLATASHPDHGRP